MTHAGTSAAAMAATPPPLFSVWNVNLAAYILATGRLRYYGVDALRGRKSVELLFEDTENVGPTLERAYAARTATADPRSLFDAAKFLRNEMARAQREAAEGARVEPVRL